MKIKNNYIVSVLVCAVLFLASCAEETLVDNPHAQNAFRTVSVDLGMPQGKPAYGGGTDSRAQMADTTATGYRLSFDTAETGKPDASRAGSNDWIDGDRLLLHIVASNEDQTTQTTEGMLTLTYSDSKWSLDAVNSYTKYGASFVAYNSAQPKLLITDDDTDIDLANLKMQVDEKIGMSANVTATLFYAPHMKWSPTEGSVTLVVDETASTYEKWEWTNTNTNSSWTTPYARLRVNTGNGNAGDVVTLTSSAFDSACEVEPTEGIYTATTDAEGNAYFYGITNGTLTDNFLVELTQMRVPVPTAAPASEGRSITLEDESTLLIDLDEPITLLEASDVVPVTLAATKAYKLMMSEDKRNTQVSANLSVIDGSCTNLDLITKQIKTAMAKGIYDFTVINQLARDYDPNEAETVVGQAIHDLASDESSPNYGTISITIADATELSNGAFFECYALKSVTFNQPVAIRGWVFRNCTALTGVDWANVASIGAAAFGGCTITGPITINQGTELVSEAFEDCTITGTLTIGEGVNVDAAAFSGANVSNCDLTLAEGLLAKNGDLRTNDSADLTVSVSNSKQLMYAGAAWKSITLLDDPAGTANTKYYIDENYMPTVEVDGTCGNEQDGDVDDYYAMTNKIKAVVRDANDNIPAKVIVKKGLTPLDGMAKTVVGEALSVGIVHLVLDDAITSIPEEAFVDRTPLVSVTTSATTIGARAFNNCASLISVSLRATSATTIERSAFSQCHTLATVNLSANTAIGDYAFMTCTALTGMDWSKVTSIGVVAFANCTSLTGTLNLDNVNSIGEGAFVSCSGLTGISSLGSVDTIERETFRNCSSLDGELNLPNVTSIGESSFSGCNFTEVTFGKVVTTYNNAFTGAAVSNCDLELAAGQSGVTTENGKLMWAGAEWNSITIGNVPLTVVGNEIYAVIDGTCEDVDKVKVQIQNAPGNAEGKKNILVIDGLAQYSNSGSAGTVVGEAIRICGAADGSISLILDDRITAIPTGAFTNCKALNSVVAKNVATIGDGAFYECTNITAITFGTIIESCLESAFGQVNSEVQPWTMSCDLTLAQGQKTSQELQVNWNVSLWANYDWKTITVGGVPYFPSNNPS